MGWNNDIYEITTPQDFVDLQSLTNTGTESNPIHINVMNDIDMTHAFDEATDCWHGMIDCHCIFNGNGHTISNLNVSNTDTVGFYLFRILSGEFGNIIFDNCHVSTTSTNGFAFIIGNKSGYNAWCNMHDIKINNNCVFDAPYCPGGFVWFFGASSSSDVNFRKTKLLRVMVNATWRFMTDSGFELFIDGVGIIQHLAIGGSITAYQFVGIRGNQRYGTASWSYIFWRCKINSVANNTNLALIINLYEANNNGYIRLVYACYASLEAPDSGYHAVPLVRRYNNQLRPTRCLWDNTNVSYISGDSATSVTDIQLKDANYLRDTVGWII